MLGSIFTSHACELVVSAKGDVAEAKKHMHHCLFKRHDFVIEGIPTVVHRLCHEVRELLLELVAKFVPKNDSSMSVSGKLRNKYILLEADETFRAYRLLQLLSLKIKQLEQNTKGVSFTPPPLPRSLAPQSSSTAPSTSPLRRVLSTPTTTLKKLQINPLTFGGHYCQYTPYKNYDISTISDGKHRVMIMENMDEHPYDLVCKRLDAIGHAKKECLVIGSRTITQKSLIRDYNELKTTENEEVKTTTTSITATTTPTTPKLQGEEKGTLDKVTIIETTATTTAAKVQEEEEKRKQIERITKLVEWSYWIRIECRIVMESPSSSPITELYVPPPRRTLSLFKEDGDFEEE